MKTARERNKFKHEGHEGHQGWKNDERITFPWIFFVPLVPFVVKK
jgi:hypothetical protein